MAFCGNGKENYAYSKLSEEKFNEIVALLKTTSMTEIKIAEKFGVSLITINQINTGHTLFHENIDYPIRKYKDPKYCKYCHKKLCSDNTSGYCKDCLNYFHTLPYSEQIKYLPSNLSTSPFIPTNQKELFIFLYYNPFSVVAKHYSTTKKKILIYLQHNNIPNIVEDYRLWFENNYKDYLPKDNKQEIIRKIYVQKSLDNSYIAEYTTVSEAARSINKGIYNHGEHIKSAAISYKYYKIYPDNCFL